MTQMHTLDPRTAQQSPAYTPAAPQQGGGASTPEDAREQTTLPQATQSASAGGSKRARASKNAGGSKNADGSSKSSSKSDSRAAASRQSPGQMLKLGILSALALGNSAAAYQISRRGLGDSVPSLPRTLAPTPTPAPAPAPAANKLAPAPQPPACDALYQHFDAPNVQPTPAFVDCDGTLKPAIPTPLELDLPSSYLQPMYVYNGKPTTLFGAQGPLGTDVAQNQIGNCMARAAQRAIATANPALVLNTILPTGSPNIANVSLTFDGKAQWTLVNNQFPQLPNGALAYGSAYPSYIVRHQPQRLVTFSAFQEQALAQLAGPRYNLPASYRWLDLRQSPMDVPTMVGALAQGAAVDTTDVGTFYNRPDSELLDSLREATAHGIPTFAGTWRDGDNGIVGDHAYVIMGVSGNQIVSANPWGANPNSITTPLYVMNQTAPHTSQLLDRGFLALTPQDITNCFNVIYKVRIPVGTPGPIPTLATPNGVVVWNGTQKALPADPDGDYGNYGTVTSN